MLGKLISKDFNLDDPGNTRNTHSSTIEIGDTDFRGQSYSLEIISYLEPKDNIVYAIAQKLANMGINFQGRAQLPARKSVA